MAEIKGQGNLDKSDDKNGLIAQASQLADEAAGRARKRKRAAFVIYEPLRTTIEDEREIVTVMFLRIEPLLMVDLPEAEKFVRRALEARYREEVLPLELEDEITKVFREMAEADSPKDPDEDKAEPGDRAAGDDEPPGDGGKAAEE